MIIGSDYIASQFREHLLTSNFLFFTNEDSNAVYGIKVLGIQCVT